MVKNDVGQPLLGRPGRPSPSVREGGVLLEVVRASVGVFVHPGLFYASGYFLVDVGSDHQTSEQDRWGCDVPLIENSLDR